MPPAGGKHAPHIQYREEWDRAITLDEEQRVYSAAKKELEAWTRRQSTAIVAGETQDQLEKRIAKEGEGWTVEEVAQHCRVTPTFVRRARLKDGRDVRTGVKPEDVKSVFEAEDRALDLAAKGYTERQIAMLTKLSKTTVRRVCGKAA